MVVYVQPRRARRRVVPVTATPLLDSSYAAYAPVPVAPAAAYAAAPGYQAYSRAPRRQFGVQPRIDARSQLVALQERLRRIYNVEPDLGRGLYSMSNPTLPSRLHPVIRHDAKKMSHVANQLNLQAYPELKRPEILQPSVMQLPVPGAVPVAPMNEMGSLVLL